MKERIQNFIDGTLQEPLSGNYLPVINPATGQKVAEVADSDVRDVKLAVAAAQAAFPGWAATPPRERSQILRKISTLILEKLEVLALTETLNTGKPLRISKTVDIPRSAYNFEFFADAITQWGSESYTTSPTTLNYVLRQPLGVVACISPWNLPLYLFSWKVAPALAAGNCVVAKPSEVTPWTAAWLGQLSLEAGLPPGVLNIVHGLGNKVGEALCEDPQIKAVSFTGSTRTGAEISKRVAPRFKKLSLELGGKNASVVFADCNFEKAVKEVARAAFSNQGQICLCGSRIFVEKSIYEKFKTALVAEVKKLKVGDPLHLDIDQGAVVSKLHFDKVMKCLSLASEEGGKFVFGGKALKLSGENAEGYFIQPTLIEGLSNKSLTNQEEIFGPVATLIPFESTEEAIELVNDSRYGLAASIWTQNLNTAHRVAAELHTGIVWINSWMLRDLRTPFGGVKESGVGREGGVEALRFFTEAKTVCVSYEEESK